MIWLFIKTANDEVYISTELDLAPLTDGSVRIETIRDVTNLFYGLQRYFENDP